MQTTLCVPLEVRPESFSRLSALIEDFRLEEDKGKGALPENFGRIARDIPVLHFMSVSVFPSSDYDPMFVFEANFDGTPGVFWGQVEAVFGPRLREMLRCCKQPLDGDGPLYKAVTAPNSRAPVAPYFEARTQWPSAFHHGNRGMPRDQILTEADLFDDIRSEFDDPARHPTDVYRSLSAGAVHDRLRKLLLPKYPWLDAPVPQRIPQSVKIMDWVKLMLFAVVLLLVLSLPGVIAASLMKTWPYVRLIIFLALVILALIYFARKPLPGTDVPTKFNLVGFLIDNAALIALIVGAAAFFVTLLMWPVVALAKYVLMFLSAGPWPDLSKTFLPMMGTAALGLLSLIVVAPLIILWLRHLERRDSSQEAPPPYPDVAREMMRQEDWVAQNHMGSMVLIKPGILRMILIRAGHRGLGLLLRVMRTSREGYLGSMRTVHFAHWAFLNNRSRLLFLSNFDQSWGSYLDDFIEKANVGTTLAWGAGVGFPPTRFLIYDGSSNGRMFKAWALASRTVSRFWYSAYPKLTVNQIERNNRIANGLRQRRMTETEASTWMTDL